MPDNPSIWDIGADEYGLSPFPLRITLYVKDHVVSPGDLLPVHALIQTNFPAQQYGDFWIMATLPDHSEYGPIYGPIGGVVAAGYTYTSLYLNLAVPSIAPIG